MSLLPSQYDEHSKACDECLEVDQRSRSKAGWFRDMTITRRRCDIGIMLLKEQIVARMRILGITDSRIVQ